MESAEGWKWYGYAGHLCVSRRCAYHLCTRIGDYLISTVGAYYPFGSDKMETIGGGREDFYETFVFKCEGDDNNGDPIITTDEIDTKRYAKSIEAEEGHYAFCWKYQHITDGEKIKGPA